SVIIEPSLGRLENLEVEFPHPKGIIKVSYIKSGNRIKAKVKLPKDVKGVFKWKGKSTKLVAGEQNISL
ncbi:MAG: hypothetical protein ABFS35_19975, partial [Bacteroidota bacterium]